ncbi:hypothetical protein KAR26_01390 [Candidatus Parcubacteria bacterium]|nr:hypothetical protein [Candidatus Parcubacteria bacterium]MCK5590798.1 hypothetical protein [Candidatus Paceibacterota bacterium]
MLYSKLFSKSLKNVKKYDSLNATLLQKGGFIDQVMAGVYSYLPLGLRVLRKIEHIVRSEMDAIGGQEILMPVLHPKKNWEKTNRWDNMDILFKLKGAGDKDFALGPTHEEIVTPLAQKMVFSYKDLPVVVYQIQDKFRNEPRAKSGILRGREFIMKDMYSFHTSEKDMDVFYEQVERAYETIWQRLGIDKITLKTYASGGSFSKYSHEYQTLCDTGEDIIYICDKCNVAINKEIVSEHKACIQCGNKDLTEKKAIEAGNIFKLKTKFSDAFNFKFTDKDGKEKGVEMGCFGLGVTRVMGILAECFNDDKGLIWPESVSPYKVHLIGLNLEDEEIKQKTFDVYEKLQSAGVDVLFDDRENMSAGEKFADADLVGITWRAVSSKRTGDKIEVKKRRDAEGKLMPIQDLLKMVAD